MTAFEIEAQALAEFTSGIAQRLAAFQQLAAPLDRMWASADQQLLTLQVIQSLWQAEEFVAGFTARAEALRGPGYPRLAEQVAGAQQDIQTAKIKYLEIYQNSVAVLRQGQQAMTDAQQFALRNFLEATAHQQAVVDAGLRGIRAVQNHQCPNCQLYFGDSYPYWRWCPRCRARV